MPGRKTAPKGRGRKKKIEEEEVPEEEVSEKEEPQEDVDEDNKADEEEDENKLKAEESEKSEEEKPTKKTEHTKVEKEEEENKQKKELTPEEVKKKLTVDTKKLGKKKLEETSLLELLQYAYTKAETDMNSIIARGIEELYKGHISGRYIHVNRPLSEYLKRRENFANRNPRGRYPYRQDRQEGYYEGSRLQAPPKFSQQIVEQLARKPFKRNEEPEGHPKKYETPTDEEEVNITSKKKMKKEREEQDE
jgi:hypothetical protein